MFYSLVFLSINYIFLIHYYKYTKKGLFVKENHSHKLSSPAIILTYKKREDHADESHAPSPLIIANTISRVLYSHKGEPLSFIYDYGHPQPLATYPPTLDEQPLIVGIRGLATRKTYGQTTLLPLRWALTPPFHPYPKQARKKKKFITPLPLNSPLAVILCYATTPSRTSSR